MQRGRHSSGRSSQVSERRASDNASIETGTTEETLLVLHGDAQTSYKQGHSGLCHVAIHPPTARDFAGVMKRFLDRNYRIGPTDHTFLKAFYLDDLDDINIEFTLETPERFREVHPVGNRLALIGWSGAAGWLPAPSAPKWKDRRSLRSEPIRA